MTRHSFFFSAALFSASLCGLACAQDADAPDAPTQPTQTRAGWFPFVIPTLGDEQTSGSALDLSFLNSKPAGADGFVRAQGERIVDGAGHEIKFFGTNITDYAVMPPKDKATPIAARLQQLGINFVRLHYYDWAKAPDGLMNDDWQTLNPDKLDQMDWLIFQLKQHGIYVDINLHVARVYPDLPQGWFWMGKSLDRIHPSFIASQKQFARDLLSHVNPYTKTAYTDEPAVAVVELNNENTALNLNEGISPLAFAALDDKVKSPIRALWNAWLQDKYNSTAKLRAAWNSAPQGQTKELLRNADWSDGTAQWQLENGAGKLSVVRENNESFLRWNEAAAGPQSYSLQLHQRAVAVREGQALRLRFRARSNEKRAIQVRLMQDAGEYKDAGLVQELQLTPQWQQFDIAGAAYNARDVPIRLSFDAYNTPGTLDIADISLREDAALGLAEGVSLERGEVPLPGFSAPPPVRTDYLLFAGERERQNSAEVAAFLRDELKVKSLIWDSQANFGGARGLAREIAVSDAIDVHEYPVHPSGEQNAEGKWTWSTRRQSLLGEVFDRVPRLAQWRVAGRPFFVSEFDLNPPNDYASESYPLLSAIAAYQGWSGLADYAWLNFPGDDYDPSAIKSPFQTAGHAGQVAFMPASALLFRRGLLQPAQARATLTIAPKTLGEGDFESGAMADIWQAAGARNSDGWRAALAVVPQTGAPTQLSDAPAKSDDKIVVSDTGQIRFNREKAGQETMTVNAPALKMALGHTGGQSFELGEATIRVERGTLENYANLMVVALDGLPLAQSKRVLVTAVARVENAGMKYNAQRTSVGQNWGEGPTLAEPVKFAVSVPGTGWTASALDGKGRKMSALKMDGATLRVTAPSSLWYLLER